MKYLYATAFIFMSFHIKALPDNHMNDFVNLFDQYCYSFKDKPKSSQHAYLEKQGHKINPDYDAYEILIEGRVFDAQEAFQKGLVSRIVADDQVETEALETANRIVEGAPLVHRWHRKFLERLKNPTPISVEENREGFSCYDTDDFAEGYKAFLDKRKPEFKGK